MKARDDFKFLTPVDKSWTLFLDRDGVINVNKHESYIYNCNEFFFREGALEAIASLSEQFGKIIVITNQRGVGKGLMTVEMLEEIHQFMNEKISCVGGRIDDIFYCTALEMDHPDRKPNPGMAWKAKEKYPEIDFAKSIMIGDKSTDMQWARSIGAFGVLISPNPLRVRKMVPEAHYSCDSLFTFATWCIRACRST
jgi:histidinol-phosphate phosphatase family protein